MTFADLAVAHASAAASLRYLGLTTPGSLDVLAYLRRAGHDVRQREVLERCAFEGLRLADARTESMGRARPAWLE